MDSRIIIAIALVTTIITIVFTYSSLENNISKQNLSDELLARIHLITDNGITYVKLNDLAPNSARFFIYPYYENATVGSFNSWILIRLSSNLGGNASDISSYRAYNIKDLDPNGFPLRYDSKREILHEIQFGDTYEPTNGMIVEGYNFNRIHENRTLPNALPNLDLGVDEEGYIYVKTPTLDVNKNGVIGLGRIVS